MKISTSFRALVIGVMAAVCAFPQAGTTTTTYVNGVPTTLVWVAPNIAQGGVQVPLTLAQLTTMFTTPIPVVPAFGAGTLVEVQSCVLDMVFGSAAFTGGGTVTVGYGTTQSTVAASTAAATIAATVFTTFTASQSILTLGTMPVTASTLNLNKAVSITNGTAVFAGGTAASAVLDCTYRVHFGLS